jgi:cytochrome P450
MQRFGTLMTEVAEREIASWPTGVALKLWPRMQAVTLEVIVRAVFGMSEGRRMDELRTRLRALTESTSDRRTMATLAAIGPDRLARLPWFKRTIAPVDEVVFDEIRARRGAGDLAERDDILSLLLQARHEDGSPMSDRELRDELMTLLVAGHETTATSLAWAIERLLRHPDVLERLRSDPGDDAYLDAVIKETLRLRPVLPIVVRKLQAPMEIAGWELPAGVTVAPCIHLLHRREDVYPEPRRFRPERFLERPAGTYTWIPFGGGVRRCLGASFALLEMQAVLRALVRSAALRPARPESERVRRRSITLTPEHGAEVVVAA